MDWTQLMTTIDRPLPTIIYIMNSFNGTMVNATGQIILFSDSCLSQTFLQTFFLSYCGGVNIEAADMHGDKRKRYILSFLLDVFIQIYVFL